MKTGEYAELLAKRQAVRGTQARDLAKLAAQLESVAVPAGAELFREGDPGDAFYLVARGSLGLHVYQLRALGDDELADLVRKAGSIPAAPDAALPRAATRESRR